MKFKVVKRCQEDLSSVHNLLKSFLPFARKRMGFNKPPTIFFQSDDANAKRLLGKTAQYEPSTMHITVYVTGRHPKDVLRSLSHELVHHGQNCRGEFGHVPETAPGYAQSSDHLRGMEEEAYKVGNLCFRDWEDGVKTNKIAISMPLKENLMKEQNKTHTVKSGETISSIAGTYYNDIHAWPAIYKVNTAAFLGGDPDIIDPGVTLQIPDKSTWNAMDQNKRNQYYAMSSFYAEKDGMYHPISGGMGETGPESVEELEGGLEAGDFATSGTPVGDANAEFVLWSGRKESDPGIKNRLSAMWQWSGVRVLPEDANVFSKTHHWSGVAISWFFRSEPSFPRSSTHFEYITRAEHNREKEIPGYQLFTPDEINNTYEPNDIICYLGSQGYQGWHCDIYMGNDMCIGGNLGHTVARIQIRKDEVKQVIRKVDRAQSLQEWKNQEINRLLLEKFNLGVNKK